MKKIAILSLAVLLMLASMPFAWAEELVLPPEVKATLDRLEVKIKAEGKETRKEMDILHKQTGDAISDAGKQTAGAIDRQTEAIKQGIKGQTAAIEQLGDTNKRLTNFSIFVIAIVVLSSFIIFGVFIWYLTKRLRKQGEAMVKNEIADAVVKVIEKMEASPVTVSFSINGQKYTYTPLVKGGRYWPPNSIALGVSVSYQDPIDLRRAALNQLKRDPALLEQELDAKRLQPVIHLVATQKTEAA